MLLQFWRGRTGENQKVSFAFSSSEPRTAELTHCPKARRRTPARRDISVTTAHETEDWVQVESDSSFESDSDGAGAGALASS